MMNQRIAILVDGNNIEMNIQNKIGVNFLLKYEEFVNKITKDRSLIRMVYFREGISISEKLTNKLKKFYGVTVPCHKSADIPLAIEAIRLCDKIDTIIIFSGDSDYVELVKYLHYKGVRVEIVGLNGSISKLLINESDDVHYITEEDCHNYKHDPKFRKNV